MPCFSGCTRVRLREKSEKVKEQVKEITTWTASWKLVFRCSRSFKTELRRFLKVSICAVSQSLEGARELAARLGFKPITLWSQTELSFVRSSRFALNTGANRRDSYLETDIKWRSKIRGYLQNVLQILFTRCRRYVWIEIIGQWSHG